MSPCPPPEPDTYTAPECPRPLPVNITGSVMSPGCYANNCGTWGIAKVTDNQMIGTRSLGMTVSATDPYMQLDLGSMVTTLLAVRVTARSDASLSQSQNLTVYFSETKDFTAEGVTVCQANITFSVMGEDALVLCPDGSSGRYVTVKKFGTGVFSLQEITPLYDGEWIIWFHPSMALDMCSAGWSHARRRDTHTLAAAKGNALAVWSEVSTTCLTAHSSPPVLLPCSCSLSANACVRPA